MDSDKKLDLPIVQDATRTQSENIQTIVSRLRSQRIYIPDYQRDADQWDDRKKSIFIESLLNNLTIPAFFLGEDDDRKYEVVDGQQRLTTILDFANNKFQISPNEDIVYLLPQAVQYRGKKYEELSAGLKNIFDDYPLTIIYLPKNLPLGIKLEIFRRINEGGTPLTGQDIRLAYYSESPRVTFIRLCGIYSERAAALRMVDVAREKGLSCPWDKYPDAKEIWYGWWEDKEKAKGQTPSLMFLWFLVCLSRSVLDSILTTPGGTNHVNISFRGTTEEALDIYCAQLRYEDLSQGRDENHHRVLLLPSMEQLEDYFKQFAKWIKYILSRGLTGINVDKDKQLALFIAGVVELELSPTSFSERQWNLAGRFIRSPRATSQEIFGDDDSYPEPRGRWNGAKGQKVQLDKAVEFVKKIKELG